MDGDDQERSSEPTGAEGSDRPPRFELRGERVTLRSVVAADRPAVVAMRAKPEIQARWRGDNLAAEFDDDLADTDLVQLAIEVEGELVGLIQFAEEAEPDYRHASVDLFVDPDHWRRGYALDAIGTVVDHLMGERGHHRLTIDPAADNEAAIACYTRVGFRPVGVMHRYERQADGVWADGLLMELVAPDNDN